MIGRGGDDTVDAAGRCGRGGAEGQSRGPDKAPTEDRGGNHRRARVGPIAAGGQKQGKVLHLL